MGSFLDVFERICEAHIARGDTTAALVAAERAAAMSHPYVEQPRRQARERPRDRSRGRRSQLCEVTALRVPWRPPAVEVWKAAKKRHMKL